jgi:hypothetical protein
MTPVATRSPFIRPTPTILNNRHKRYPGDGESAGGAWRKTGDGGANRQRDASLPICTIDISDFFIAIWKTPVVQVLQRSKMPAPAAPGVRLTAFDAQRIADSWRPPCPRRPERTLESAFAPRKGILSLRERRRKDPTSAFPVGPPFRLISHSPRSDAPGWERVARDALRACGFRWLTTRSVKKTSSHAFEAVNVSACFADSAGR